MNQHTFGSTSLKTSRLGLGLSALGRPASVSFGARDNSGRDYSIEGMQRRAFKILDAAYSGGIRYFDAARSYGKSEQFLRSWLDARQKAPDCIVIGSKWGYIYSADWQVDVNVHEVKDHSLELLQRQYAESRAHLGNYLHLYMIHSATLKSGVLENNDVLDEIFRIKSEGLAVGFSTSGPDQAGVIKHGLNIFRGNERLFDCIEVTWNLLEQSASHTLEEAHRLGVNVIVKEALANGRLTKRNFETKEGNRLAVLGEEAQRLNTSISLISLAAVLNQSWVDTVLMGTTRINHLQANLKALQMNIDPQTMQRLLLMAEIPQDYWKTRRALPWQKS